MYTTLPSIRITYIEIIHSYMRSYRSMLESPFPPIRLSANQARLCNKHIIQPCHSGRSHSLTSKPITSWFYIPPPSAMQPAYSHPTNCASAATATASRLKLRIGVSWLDKTVRLKQLSLHAAQPARDPGAKTPDIYTYRMHKHAGVRL